jgi:hypothetical protein
MPLTSHVHYVLPYGLTAITLSTILYLGAGLLFIPQIKL